MIHYNTNALHAAQMLDPILSILPGAVIAGGYLRDKLLDRPVRDLDVMTEEVPTANQLAELAVFMGLPFDAFVDTDATLDEDYVATEERGSEIVRLFKAPGIDVIVTSDLPTHLIEFPDNISRVYYDVNGLHMGLGFNEGHQTKTIVYRDAAGTGRLLKLIAKFPDYRVSHV